MKNVLPSYIRELSQSSTNSMACFLFAVFLFLIFFFILWYRSRMFQILRLGSLIVPFKHWPYHISHLSTKEQTETRSLNNIEGERWDRNQLCGVVGGAVVECFVKWLNLVQIERWRIFDANWVTKSYFDAMKIDSDGVTRDRSKIYFYGKCWS